MLEKDLVSATIALIVSGFPSFLVIIVFQKFGFLIIADTSDRTTITSIRIAIAIVSVLVALCLNNSLFQLGIFKLNEDFPLALLLFLSVVMGCSFVVSAIVTIILWFGIKIVPQCLKNRFRTHSDLITIQSVLREKCPDGYIKCVYIYDFDDNFIELGDIYAFGDMSTDKGIAFSGDAYPETEKLPIEIMRNLYNGTPLRLKKIVIDTEAKLKFYMIMTKKTAESSKSLQENTCKVTIGEFIITTLLVVTLILAICVLLFLLRLIIS